MRRIECVDWECVTPLTDSKNQLRWLATTASKKLGISCCKGTHPQSQCDYRPAFGEIFADKYEGYDWWGWCDLDIMFGRVDELLPPLLDDSCDVLTFKDKYLSGCFTILRNTKDIRNVFRTGHYKEILNDEYYHLWDESGRDKYPGEHFARLLEDSGYRIRKEIFAPGYDAPQEDNRVSWIDGRLIFEMTGREVLFHHFMSDVWPVKPDGTSRYQ